MEQKTELASVVLPNGQTMRMEATVVDELEAAGFEAKKFDGVIGAIEGIGMAVQAALAKLKSVKASVELGLELGLEAGHLTALLVQGAGKANLKVTLHWDQLA
jgi:hypothetical protein